ncbi:MAG: DUF134 domain-containing protein [Prolixibacteraceae bacterium]|jgi:predicted DNA-binding protein (UPF0251 family)|nr:DUF134 domain-containing protein [Prolixibacteraceae bacterium]
MPRPRQISKVQIPPRVRGFIPVGYYKDQSEPVQLNIEEYEAIRLLDYEGLSQVEASHLMQISRPTLTRIYERARKKIATALTEAHQIVIEGGNAIFNGSWFECERCNCKFNNPNELPVQSCPVCESFNLHHLED